MKKILFVCTANICRSPMACAVFNALAHDNGLPYVASSAGVAALKGRPMPDNAVEVLEEAGIQSETHRARQVSSEMLSGADLVLAMNSAHVAELQQLSENRLTRQIHTLPDYASGTVNGEISDPYGYPVTAYRACLRQLYEHVGRVVLRLQSTR